jgi:hypothetical protein
MTTMRVDEALAAELEYRRERLMALQQRRGGARSRWLPRRSRRGE